MYTETTVLSNNYISYICPSPQTGQVLEFLSPKIIQKILEGQQSSDYKGNQIPIFWISAVFEENIQ